MSVLGKRVLEVGSKSESRARGCDGNGAGAGRRRRAGEGCGRTCHNLIPQFDDLENVAQMQGRARRRHSCQHAEGALHVRRDARLDELVVQQEARHFVAQGTANGAHRGRVPAPPRKVLQHPRSLRRHRREVSVDQTVGGNR